MKKYDVMYHNANTEKWESFIVEANDPYEAECIGRKKLIKEKISFYQITACEAGKSLF